MFFIALRDMLQDIDIVSMDCYKETRVELSNYIKMTYYLTPMVIDGGIRTAKPQSCGSLSEFFEMVLSQN